MTQLSAAPPLGSSPVSQDNQPPLILGLVGSLRNARSGSGCAELVADLEQLTTESDLQAYLAEQADLHLQNFIDAGRGSGLSFKEIYHNLSKLRGTRGLSNSEITAAAALWAAHHAGARIDCVALKEHFHGPGAAQRREKLLERLSQADGILVSSPVYFGDRSSLVQEFSEWFRLTPKELRPRVYGGLAVGAKRNGGQETTLVYSLLDFVGMGLLAVGNDSDTTAQYGGTGHAGDVGTMANDQYGLWTSMGTGRRLAHVTELVRTGLRRPFTGKLRVMFWILQEKQEQSRRVLDDLLLRFGDRIEPTVVNISEHQVEACLACDICPTRVGPDEDYRCIIGDRKRDSLAALHASFLDQDAIVPIAYSPQDRNGLTPVSRRFLERTRYLRRGDYVFSDTLFAPLVIEDLGHSENLNIRLTTSLIRHHTVAAAPMVLYAQGGSLLNMEQVNGQFATFLDNAALLTGGRLESMSSDAPERARMYNPVGYILSAVKAKELDMKDRTNILALRDVRRKADASARRKG